MSKKTADQWFAEYGECHRNPVNELIHWICIPAIILSLVGLLWEIPVPAGLESLSPRLNVATLTVAVCLLFYLRLSIPLAVGMLLFMLVVCGAISWYRQTGWTSLWSASLGIFVVAWIFQFVGHKVEGKKPAFFRDVQFLLIGPIWLLGSVYRKLGIRY